MARKSKSSSLAETLGGTLAVVQHAADSLTAWGFRALKKAGAPEERRRKRPPTRLDPAKRAGKAVLSFLGQLGDSYYRKYEDLKSDRRAKREDG